MSAIVYYVEIDLYDEDLLRTLVRPLQFGLNFLHVKYRPSPYEPK
jgi:hypothetical protein